MIKQRIVLGMAGFCYAITASSLQIQPVTTVSMGSGLVDVNQQQNIVFIAPLQNTFNSKANASPFVTGAFLGLQTSVQHALQAQIGASYYYNTAFNVRGTIDEFGTPLYKNLGYDFKLTSQAVYAEGKLLTTWRQVVHPFITAGVGQVYNRTSHYDEYPLVDSSVVTNLAFGDNSTNGFSYFLGLGVENEVTQHVHLGFSYRWVDLNKAQLASSPYQESPAPLGTNTMYANELLIQLSYLG